MMALLVAAFQVAVFLCMVGFALFVVWLAFIAVCTAVVAIAGGLITLFEKVL